MKNILLTSQMQIKTLTSHIQIQRCEQEIVCLKDFISKQTNFSVPIMLDLRPVFSGHNVQIPLWMKEHGDQLRLKLA